MGGQGQGCLWVGRARHWMKRRSGGSAGAAAHDITMALPMQRDASLTACSAASPLQRRDQGQGASIIALVQLARGAHSGRQPGARRRRRRQGEPNPAAPPLQALA